MKATIDELAVADEPGAWRALGFAVEGAICVVGEVRVRLAGAGAGRGIVGWSLRGLGAGEDATADLDGLATSRSERPPPAAAPAHPNGVTGLDHVVAISPDLDRTVAASPPCAAPRVWPRPSP